MRHRVITCVASLLAATAMPAAAQDGLMLPEDFAPDYMPFDIESLMVEIPSPYYPSSGSADTITLQTGTIDLGGPLAEGDGTVAFTNFTPRTAVASTTLSAVPLEPGVNPLALSGFTPRYADSYLSIGGSNNESGKAPLVQVGVHSRIVIRPGALFNEASPELDSYQSYNLGLNVGVSRFRLGASFLREDSGVFGESQGYDLGLSYGGEKWSTSLEFEFVDRLAASEGLSIEGVNDGFQAVELGASFQASRRIAVTGGLKIFDYETDPNLDPSAADYSGLFYLGTRLSF